MLPQPAPRRTTPATHRPLRRAVATLAATTAAAGTALALTATGGSALAAHRAGGAALRASVRADQQNCVIFDYNDGRPSRYFCIDYPTRVGAV